MQKDSAKNLIQETLQSSFDKEHFVYLIKNILNHIEEAPFTYKGNFIFDDFADSIKTVERIGKYKDPEDKLIDILIVRLQKETSLERARTKQRNFVAKYLKGSRGGVLKDAALAAFVSPQGDDWRFSLVKMEYKFNEKGKVEEEFTPARRYSFLVGKNENSHTAQSRLLPLLLNDEINPTLKELEDVFSVEKVTKEFFEKYRDLFIRTVDELDKILKKDEKIGKDFATKNINTVDFAKKLLGQIVFLYFLQKKGWFGVAEDKKWGEGDKNFVRNLFKKAQSEGKNFFNSYLEFLFYDTLNNPRSNQADPTYSKHFNCKIPFLNGGLFEPVGGYDWEHKDILLPNELFSNNLTTSKGDIGNGILDVFDRFNFTVQEDEPLEKEVAIDPELLGKLYERFNAIRADNFYEYKKVLESRKKELEKKFNKEYGVYYTPREIVHYMCQESLVNYLAGELYGKANKDDIKKLIKEGEHLLENESIAQIKREKIERGEQKTTRYNPKLLDSIKPYAREIDDALKNIKICDPAVGSGAFPVGMMTEIVKARNIFSLFMDEPGRTPYNFKRECIEKSLYGVDIDSGACEISKLRLWLSLIVEEEDVRKIKPLPNLDYKIVCGNSLLGFPENWKSEISEKIEELKKDYFAETNPSKKRELKSEIDKNINWRLENSEKHFGYKINFDFRLFFSEVFHQKSGFDVVIANPPYGIVYDKQSKQQLVKSFPTFKRNNDIYIAFYERGLGLLRVGGVLIYISPNTFLNGDYFKDFRKLLTSKTCSREIFDFKELHIFEDPTVFVCTICCQRQQEMDLPYEYELRVAENSLKDVPKQNVVITGPTANSLKVENRLYSRLISQNEIDPAENIFYIKDVGFNYWTKGRGKKRGGGSIGDRVFYSGKPRNRKDTPFLKGRDISRYHIKRPTNFLLHDYEHRLDPKVDTLRSTPAFLERKPKIIYRQTANRIIAALDTSGHYLDKTVHLIVSKNNYSHVDMKYVLGLLNSTLFNYLYADIAQEREGRAFAQVKTTYLKKLPIKISSAAEQKSLIALVDKILAITKDDDYLENPAKQAKVREYEKQIDQFVYELYGLTPEEIEIVEGKN